jgi:glycosyltransferase involved in cell wall biosynthesis
MGINQHKIAILCNYKLLPERLGGMDYFFWEFERKCKDNYVQVDWFFPNKASHGSYSQLHIIESKEEEVEIFFSNYLQNNKVLYSHVFTHFVEVCAPIFKKISRFSSAKIICVDHNPRPIAGYSVRKKIKKRVKGLFFSKYISEFIAVSNYSKNQLVKEFGSKIAARISVIPNGLQFEKFEQKTDFILKNKFIIACHLREDKGIQDVIEAVALIQNEEKLKIDIDVYGSGFYEKELKDLCQHLNVTVYFNFKGSVNNLNEIYKNYDYLIHPSHGETFCYSVVESLICNLPVITTKNQGNVLGLVRDNYNGFLFEEGNVEALKNILELVISTEHQINALTNYNPELKQLTLEKMVENYYQLLS